MGLKRVLTLTAAVAAAMLAASAVAVAQPDSSKGGRPDTAGSNIVELPVTFSVDNTNRTTVPCASDGKPYTIRGHIVAPRAALKDPQAATLYLHAVTQGEFYWQFDAVPGYNFARQQAEAGHVAVTIDRLGYGASDKPPGLDSCFGSQADTANQVVTALREGDYTADGGDAVAFDKVFLAGHSAGGLTATIAAYSFPDNIDGLINFGWADQTTAPFTATELADTTARCLSGGDPGAPPNYAEFGTDGDRILFHSATQEVRDAVDRMTNPDPCGDILSFGPAVTADQIGIPRTTAPVLIVAGEKDALFPPPALQLQGARYVGNPDVRVEQLADTAHGFNYEASHLESVALVDSWLTEHGG